MDPRRDALIPADELRDTLESRIAELLPARHEYERLNQILADLKKGTHPSLDDPPVAVRTRRPGLKRRVRSLL